MDNNQNLRASPEQQPVQESLKSQAPRALSSVIILSLVFGFLGGLFGNSVANRNAANSANLLGAKQTVTVTEQSAVIDVVKKASPAVVSIVISKDVSKIPGYGADPFSQDPFFNFYFGGGRAQSQAPAPNVQPVGAGSGFFVSADGLILTNKHVAPDDQSSYTVLTADGKKYDAKVLARDPINDLAIVKINISNAPFLSLGDSSSLQIGQRVVAIGNSLGQYQNTVTAGIISGIGRRIVAGDQKTGSSENLTGVIQTDAAINPGNSGGPLLNLAGQVVGMNTALDQQGQLVGFAIPANDAAKALTSYQKNGRIVRPFLGIRYVPVTPALAQDQKLPQDYGALIQPGQSSADPGVLPGSPAEKAGLMENDIILEVNGQKVDQDHPLGDLLKNYNPGDSVSLKVYHNNATKIVNVILGESK